MATNGTLTGRDAIRFAEEHGLRLRKYSDPTEGARDDLTIEEAEDVAREDAGLIWVSTDAPCECGALDGTTGCGIVCPVEETEDVSVLLPAHRGTAVAAGSARGLLTTLRMHRDCADAYRQSIADATAEGYEWPRLADAALIALGQLGTAYYWRTDAASGEVVARSPEAALERLIADGEWGRGKREERDIADGAWLQIADAEGVAVLRRGQIP